MKFLFVCTGNTCRSVLAHYLLREEARRRGLPWEVRSCGTHADPFFPIPEPVRTILSEKGVDLHHQPRVISPELAKWADVILAMTAQHLAAVRDAFPESASKAHLLRSYAGLDDLDVEDPIGQSEDRYRRAARSIEQALKKVMDRSASAPRARTRAPAKPARRPAARKARS